MLNRFLRAVSTTTKKGKRRKPHQQTAVMTPHQRIKQLLKKGGHKAVLHYDEYIRTLVSLHQKSSEPLNWNELSGKPEPRLPERQSLHQDVAERRFLAYKPSVVDKIFLRYKKKCNDLRKMTAQARQMDDIAYNTKLKEFKKNLQDWADIQTITRRITLDDPEAYREALEFFNPFHSLTALGARLDYEVFSGHIMVNLHIDTEATIPDYLVSHKTGRKIISHKMPVPQFNLLCREHVCSCALRIGREAFALLPVEFVLVNAYTRILNQNTEAAESAVVLSAKFKSADLLQLNFSASKGSEVIADCPHHLNFSAVSGFSQVRAIPLN